MGGGVRRNDRVPPLRDRGDDVLLLAEHFLQQLGGVPIPTVSEAAGEELLSRVWPGNVRELRNAIEHALVVTRSGRIEPEHLPAPAGTALTASGGNADRQQQLVLALRAWVADFQESQSRLPTYEELLEVVEPPFLDLALEACQNQVATAARSLGLHRHTLKKKLENR